MSCSIPSFSVAHGTVSGVKGPLVILDKVNVRTLACSTHSALCVCVWVWVGGWVCMCVGVQCLL